jgi:nucleoid-associated protein YgaU
MAKNSSENQEEKTPSEQAQSTPSDTSTSGKGKRFQKIRENKPLFGTLIVAGLIGLSALGVGAYSALNDSDGDDETEIVSEEGDNEDRQGLEDSDSSTDESSEDNSSEEEENGDNNEEDSSDNGEESETEDTDESDEQEDENGNESGDNDEDSSSEENEESDEQENNDEDDQDESEDENTSSDEEEESANTSNGNVNANGAVDTTRTGHSRNGAQKSTQNMAEIARTGVWKATDYTKGDITSSPYEVQQGDTLWEIAEGFYGDGFMWTQILNANSSQIGFLPDGSQALIFPGTQLVLPR